MQREGKIVQDIGKGMGGGLGKEKGKRNNVKVKGKEI